MLILVLLPAAAAMLAVGTAELGGPPPTAAAVTAAAELRTHLAKDDAWHSLFTDLLGPSNDASVVECIAAALMAIGRDTAGTARVLLKRCSDIPDGKELLGKRQGLLFAASAVAAEHRSNVCLNYPLTHGAELFATVQMHAHELHTHVPPSL